MTRRLRVLLLCAALAAVLASDASTAPRLGAPLAPVERRVGLKPPVVFEANRGQADQSVLFIARGRGYTLFLGAAEETLVERTRPDSPSRDRTAVPGQAGAGVLRISLLGADRAVQPRGLDELPGRSHYFRGRDPSGWIRDVPTYMRVLYTNVYPGIDLVYYGNSDGLLEHDFVVAPRADPGTISMTFEGESEVRIDDHGDLVVRRGAIDIRLRKPVVYQEADSGREAVSARYVRREGRAIGFEVAAYDETRPLVIDPVRQYVTYLGGLDEDVGTALAVDPEGNVYVTGRTRSTHFPTTPGAYDRFNSGEDVFVTKINPRASGSESLVYSTFLGPTSFIGDYGVAVDGAGSAYVTGQTAGEFPTTPNALIVALEGYYHAFLAKLDASGGQLLYSTLLGGVRAFSWGNAVAVDAAGNAYVTGATDAGDFPTRNAFQSTHRGGCYFLTDAFLVKLDPARLGDASLLYSTFLGGSQTAACGDDKAMAIAVDTSGRAYVAGVTSSSNLALRSAFQPYQGLDDGFVAKLDPSLSGDASLVYATYLGGDYHDEAAGIAVDASGHAFVAGYTGSDNFYTTPEAYQPSIGGSSSAFVAKLTPSGSDVVYSTYLSGSSSADHDRANAIAVDPDGNAWVVGQTRALDFPTTPFGTDRTCGADGQCNYDGIFAYDDAFVTVLNPTGSAIQYSTFLGGGLHDSAGGVAVDGAGNAYVVGETAATDFPVTPGAFDTSFGGVRDVFVAKLRPPLCGNGVVESEPGEACDPGADVPDDCCTADCRLVPADTDCRRSAGECDLGESCTGGSSSCPLDVKKGPGVPCSDDGEVCTDDVCDGQGSCTHPPNTVSCNDALFCNGADTCSGGGCSVHAGDPCAAGPECADTCNEAADNCLDPPGTLCDDGNACTTPDTCQGGRCTGTARFCDDGKACTADSCNAVTGQCVATPNKAACSDANPCTDDVCGTGNDATGCVHTPVVGQACDDSRACTVGETCGSDGSCGGGVPRDCGQSADTCSTPVCREEAGGCIKEPANEGAACDDGDACTEGEVCRGGVCTAGMPQTCDDGRPCTVDTCTAAGGCQHPVAADGTACDNLNGVGPDVCREGVCADPGCRDSEDGATCDDDNDCTDEDACQARACAGRQQRCRVRLRCRVGQNLVECEVSAAGNRPVEVVLERQQLPPLVIEAVAGSKCTVVLRRNPDANAGARAALGLGEPVARAKRATPRAKAAPRAVVGRAHGKIPRTRTGALTGELTLRVKLNRIGQQLLKDAGGRLPVRALVKIREPNNGGGKTRLLERLITLVRQR